jgi:hypothetical protein
MGTPRWGLQQELLRLLQPLVRRRAGLVSERIAPILADVGRTHSGRPAAEVLAALEEVVTAAGAEPDRRALDEFAREIEAGGNPFE